MKILVIMALLAIAVPAAGQDDGAAAAQIIPVIFVVSVGSEAQLQRAYRLAESIRAFGGTYKDAPIWIYGPEALIEQDLDLLKKFPALSVEVKTVIIPEETGWFYLSQMPATAAAAEKEADGKAAVIVFLDNDTIFLQEPDEFNLVPGVALGYRPVMHKNINPLYTEPLDDYWNRAYAIMNIDESTIFPIVTPADGDTIRPYFNAGCLAVRPERSLFRKWAKSYSRLCVDSTIRAEAEKTVLKRVFTFQVALIGVILNTLERSEMIELSDRYNYPIFFKEAFGAKRDFHDITEAVTIRYENFFDEPIPGWDTILKGPPDRIAWIKKHYLGE